MCIRDRPHGNARDRLADRRAAVHQRERPGAHGRHRAGAVGPDDVCGEAERIREVAGVVALAGGRTRALGELAVSDLAAVGRPGVAAGLAGGERGKE